METPPDDQIQDRPEPLRMEKWEPARFLFETELAMHFHDVRKLAIIAFELNWRKGVYDEAPQAAA